MEMLYSIRFEKVRASNIRGRLLPNPLYYKHNQMPTIVREEMGWGWGGGLGWEYTAGIPVALQYTC